MRKRDNLSNLTLGQYRGRRTSRAYRALAQAVAEAPKDFTQATTATEQKQFVRAKVLSGDKDFRDYNFKYGVDLTDLNMNNAKFDGASMPGLKLGQANNASLDGVTWMHGSVQSLTNSRLNNAFVTNLNAANLTADNLQMNGTLSAMNNFTGIQARNMSRLGGISFADSFAQGDLQNSRHSAFTVLASYNNTNARGSTISGYMALSDASDMDLSGGALEARGKYNVFNATTFDNAMISDQMAIDAEKTQANLDHAKIDNTAIAAKVTAAAAQRLPNRYAQLVQETAQDIQAPTPTLTIKRKLQAFGLAA